MIKLYSLVRGVNQQTRTVKLLRFSSNSASEVKYEDAKPYSAIPGPQNAFQLIRLMGPGGSFNDLPLDQMVKKFRDDYGTICKFPGFLGQKPMVFTFLPEDIEKVHRTEGKFPSRRVLDSIAYFRQKHRPDLYPVGAGITITQGQEWYDFRSKVQQILMQPRSAKLYVPKIDDVARDFVDKMRAIRDNNNETPANFFDAMTDWALESVAVIALDTRLGLIQDANKSKLASLVKKVFELTFEYDIQPSIWRYYQTKGFKSLLKIYDNVHEEISKYIEQAVERYEKNPTPEGVEKSVMEKMVAIDKNIAKTMAEDMLTAGVDTTSVAMATVMYCLAKNPDKQEILRQEIDRILPDKNETLNSSSFNNVPYLRAVVKEALRLVPVVNGNIRAAGENLVLQGYQIPKGVDVLLPSSLLSLDESHFKESKKFIPERWLKDNTDASCPHARDAHPFTYLPFGFGSRMCIGRRFAELEVEVLTARLMKEFRLEWHHDDFKIKSVTINLPDCPLRYKLIDL